MKIALISHGSLKTPRYAVIDGDSVVLLTDDFNIGTATLDPGTDRLALAEVKLLAPVSPSKVVCVGGDDREHAAELGNKMPEEPLLFLKPSSSLIAIGEPIELPAQSQQVEH